MAAMDISDQATRIEEAAREAALSNAALAAKRSALIPTGACLNCDNEVPEAKLFCDADCRDDFEHRQAAKRRAGRLGE
jgi:hypothetical protein